MEIPYGKVAVYVLTFIGYIYSGYGSGLLNNLRDAVLSAENIFGDVVRNAYTLVNNFKGLNEVLDAAVEEHCIFKCPNEAVIPVPNRNHRPMANGCGPLGMQIDTKYLPEMTRCCDAHDICYDTCNTDKEVCDMAFKRCLYRYCDANAKLGESIVKACKGAAKILSSGTLTLGCKSYQDAQSQACYCAPMPKNSKKDYKFTRGAGEL